MKILAQKNYLFNLTWPWRLSYRRICKLCAQQSVLLFNAILINLRRKQKKESKRLIGKKNMVLSGKNLATGCSAYKPWKLAYSLFFEQKKKKKKVIRTC